MTFLEDSLRYVPSRGHALIVNAVREVKYRAHREGWHDENPSMSTPYQMDLLDECLEGN